MQCFQLAIYANRSISYIPPRCINARTLAEDEERWHENEPYRYGAAESWLLAEHDI